jgi:hypothetical protein
LEILYFKSLNLKFDFKSIKIVQLNPSSNEQEQN